MLSALDHLYPPLFFLRHKFFEKGLGDLGTLISEGLETLDAIHASPIEINWQSKRKKNGFFLQNGVFKSPAAAYLPPETQTANLQWVQPEAFSTQTPVCLHFAMTGDTNFALRQKMAIPLAKAGISSLLLENPFYGARKPADQKGFKLNYFSDLWRMVFATLVEGRSLFHWLRKEGFLKLGATGISLGGYISGALSIIEQDETMVVVPCVAPFSGSVAFLEGKMKQCCDWNALSRTFPNAKETEKHIANLLEKTSLLAYPAPRCKKYSILVAANSDHFVPLDAKQRWHRHWPGSKLKTLSGGHLSSILFGKKFFQNEILSAFQQAFKTKKLW